MTSLFSSAMDGFGQEPSDDAAYLFSGEDTGIHGDTDFGTQSEDMDAINRYMRTTTIVNWPAAGPIKEGFIRWWDNLGWHSKSLDGDAYDEARTRRNKFQLANVKTEAERANVVRVITTGIETEEMQGKKRPPVLSTGEVGKQVKKPSAVVSTGPSMPTIRKGDSGDAVIKWQQILGVNADGKFGSGTEAATKTWQSSHGLQADGVVGPASWAKAMPPATPSDFATPGVAQVPVKPTLRLGSKGPDVSQWQTIVGVKPPTGFFGEVTVAATKKFQSARGLPVTGIVDAKTWEAALGGAPFAPSQPTSPPFAPSPKVAVSSSPKVSTTSKPSTTPSKSTLPKKSVAKRVQTIAVQTASLFDVSKWPTWAQVLGGLTVAGGVAAAAIKNKKG